MADQPSLAGPLARIGRADELTHQLEAACNAFLATRPYTVEERLDDDSAEPTFVVTSLHDVPVLPRMVSGEIAPLAGVSRLAGLSARAQGEHHGPK